MSSTPVEPIVHTPGPWYVADTTDGPSGEVHIFAEQGRFVAALLDWGHKPEVAANAALIACAPDLLKVAKNSLRLLEAVSPDLPTVPELRALIARAEGRDG
jgi:hypothetical protein